MEVPLPLPRIETEGSIEEGRGGKEWKGERLKTGEVGGSNQVKVWDFILMALGSEWDKAP